MKLICGFFVLALFVVISTSSTPFLNCEEGEPPMELRVKNCTKSPCRLRRGTNVSAEWDFTVPENTSTLTPKLRWGYMPSRINSVYDFPQEDACDTLKDTSCPLEAGDNATYMLEMPIDKQYPPLPLAIEFSFTDDNDNVVLCFQLKGRVV